MSYYAYVVAAVLFLAGLYGVVTSHNYIHIAICLTITQASTYVVLVAVGYTKSGTAPITKGGTQGQPLVDPIVQALTLTDVVVSVIILALLLSLALQALRYTGSIDPDELRDMHG